jgi:hypothetical protein
MKLSKLWSPMSDLNQDQRDISNTVVGLSSCLLGIVMVAAQTLPAQAQRMGWGNQGGAAAFPTRTAPEAAPAPQPTYTPQPAPAPAPQPQYGTFRPYGPLPEGRVIVNVDSSFEYGQILGYQVATQDNGERGNDQMVINGPSGREDVWLNCWQEERWVSYGPNTEQFVHAVVSQWCGWDS